MKEKIKAFIMIIIIIIIIIIYIYKIEIIGFLMIFLKKVLPYNNSCEAAPAIYRTNSF